MDQSKLLISQIVKLNQERLISFRLAELKRPNRPYVLLINWAKDHGKKISSCAFLMAVAATFALTGQYSQTAATILNVC